MKRTLQLAALAVLSFIAAGCGKKGIVPETTLVAAYVDLEKAYENGKTVITAIVNALPSDDERSAATAEFEQRLKVIDAYKDALKPQWAVVAFGGDLASLGSSQKFSDHVALAFRVDTDEATTDKLARGELGRENEGQAGNGGTEPQIEKDRRKEGIVYTLRYGQGYLGLIDDKYLILGRSKDAFFDMFDLYAGKSKASKDFGSLTGISGNTICRVSTAPVSSLLKRFELTRDVERFGEDCNDEELAEMILELGAVSLDIGADDEDVGLTLRVACGSSRDAKVLDHFFQSIAFSSRVACNVGAYVTKDPDRFKDVQDARRGLYREIGRLARVISSSTGSFIALSHAAVADRSGSEATISCSLSTEHFAKLAGEWISNARKASLQKAQERKAPEKKVPDKKKTPAAT